VHEVCRKAKPVLTHENVKKRTSRKLLTLDCEKGGFESLQQPQRQKNTKDSRERRGGHGKKSKRKGAGEKTWRLDKKRGTKSWREESPRRNRGKLWVRNRKTQRVEKNNGGSRSFSTDLRPEEGGPPTTGSMWHAIGKKKKKKTRGPETNESPPEKKKQPDGGA